MLHGYCKQQPILVTFCDTTDAEHEEQKNKRARRDDNMSQRIVIWETLTLDSSVREVSDELETYMN